MKISSIFLLLIFLLTSCEDLVVGAQVDAMVITPAQISLSETGMTDEFFNVEITVSGFDEAIDKNSVTIYRQDPRVDAVPESISVNGNTIKLTRIAKSWFGSVESAGEYSIGAELSSESQSINEQDLATITVVE